MASFVNKSSGSVRIHVQGEVSPSENTNKASDDVYKYKTNDHLLVLFLVLDLQNGSLFKKEKQFACILSDVEKLVHVCIFLNMPALF